MTPRRFITALVATTVGLGLLTAPAAQAYPEAYNNWYPVEYDLGADDAPAWLVTMAANGKGVVFSGDRFRDYDASTDTWGAWKRLHVSPERLTAKGNARGDVCSAWSAEFGAAIACRTAGSNTFVKTNLTDSSKATVEELAVSSDGRRALVVWHDVVNNRPREYATVYTLANRQASTTRLRGIPGGAPLQYYPVAARVGRTNGFALAYRTGAEGTSGNATYYRTFDARTGWGAQTPLRLGVPARDVVISDFTSDGTRAYASVTPDIPQGSADYPSLWWITELYADGTFTAPEAVNATLVWPVIGSSSTSVAIASFDPATRDLVVASSPDFIDAPILVTNVSSPFVGIVEGRVSDVFIVGQRYADGTDGFALVAEYNFRLNPGSDGDELEERLYTLAGEDGEGVSTLRRLGSKTGYEGMAVKLAGHGQYALTAYTSGMQLYAGAKGPVPQ